MRVLFVSNLQGSEVVILIWKTETIPERLVFDDETLIKNNPGHTCSAHKFVCE